MCELLATFWAHQEVLTMHNRYYGPTFMAIQWKKQRGIISPTLFNVVVNDLARKWLAMTAEYQTVAQEVQLYVL